MWLDKLRAYFRSEEAPNGSTADELREAKELRAEQKRHVDFITEHVRDVSARVRDDAQQAEHRLSRR